MNTETTTGQGAEDSRLQSAQPQMGHLYLSLPPKARGSFQQSGQKDSKSQRQWTLVRKQCFLDTAYSCTNEFTAIETNYTRWAQAQPDKVLAWRWGGGHQVPSLAKKL